MRIRPASALTALLGSAILGSSPPLYAEVDFRALERLAPKQRLEETIGYFSDLGSRVAGYPGAESSALYIQHQFREIGLDGISFQKYDISIPVEKGGFLEVPGEEGRFGIHGLWPNLVRTSTLPDGGIDAHLVYGGTGEFPELSGTDIEGSVVLLEFNSGDNWLNCAYLGAEAILFAEPDSTVYLEGEKKFLTMPLDMPRFWISKQDAENLRGRLQEGGSLPVHLEYRMDWERRPAWNILGVIPGYDPLLKEDTIVLEAYYDAMSVVPALAPGAEQAAGISALLELARYFRDNPPSRTVIFLATSAHHLALRGVDDFIQRYLRKEDPFIDRMVVRRVVEAALARGLIQSEGVVYRLGNLEFHGKEGLIREIADTDTILVRSVLEAALEEDEVVRREGGPFRRRR